jgi:hypothetical protein
MTVVYMNTDDIYQLFINFDVPGVRQDAGRLWKGVNTGDAGVINEALQAAYDPSAGQQALQAGEAVQQQCLGNDQSQLMGMFGKFFDKLDARDVKQDTRTEGFYDTMGTLVVAIKENHDVVQQNFQIIQEKLAETDAKMAETDAKMADNKAETDAIMAENKAETDAIMAENKAETDAKIAENKADTDAKMAEIMNALSKVATGSAPDDPANLPMRKNQRYTAESKRITLQWLLKHISNPYPNSDEMECLQNKTGVDTIKRMTSLVNQIRIKEMVKDKKNKNGKWCRRTTTKPSVLGNKHSWSLKSISDCM